MGRSDAQASPSTSAPATAGALDGLVVLDATQMLAGPLAAMRLGDLGADVIKIESPRGGEYNRTHGFQDLTAGGQMTTFLAVNRNKRSLAVDLKHPDGLATMHDLVAHADVFIQNFRHGTADRIGVGYEQLREINPRLVYCSISGYGAEGPYRDRPGQDLVLQGYSGSMFSVGREGDPPSASALWAADVMTGYQAVIGVLAAIEARHRTGEGQKVEVDMFSVVLDCQAQEIVTYLNTGQMPKRTEETGAHASIGAPYGTYKTADGWLTLAMAHIPNLGDALDDDWLRSLEAYNDGHKHRDDIYRRIRHRFENRTTEEWLEVLDANGVWAGPVYDYEDIEHDAHVEATGMIAEQPQSFGPVRTIRPPIRMSGTPESIRRGAPLLGEDSERIMYEMLDYERDRIRHLVEEGAIGAIDDPSASPAGASSEVTK